MQASFSDLEYAAKKKVTRRDRFLGEINTVTPWSALVAEIEPFYPKREGRGRPPIGVERMLRIGIHDEVGRLRGRAAERQPGLHLVDGAERNAVVASGRSGSSLPMLLTLPTRSPPPRLMSTWQGRGPRSPS